MFHNLFPKIVPCMRQCGKIQYRRTSHSRQYKTAHAPFMLGN